MSELITLGLLFLFVVAVFLFLKKISQNGLESTIIKEGTNKKEKSLLYAQIFKSKEKRLFKLCLILLILPFILILSLIFPSLYVYLSSLLSPFFGIFHLFAIGCAFAFFIAIYYILYARIHWDITLKIMRVLDSLGISEFRPRYDLLGFPSSIAIEEFKDKKIEVSYSQDKKIGTTYSKGAMRLKSRSGPITISVDARARTTYPNFNNLKAKRISFKLMLTKEEMFRAFTVWSAYKLLEEKLKSVLKFLINYPVEKWEEKQFLVTTPEISESILSSLESEPLEPISEYLLKSWEEEDFRSQKISQNA